MTRRPAGPTPPPRRADPAAVPPGDRADLAGFPRLADAFCEDMAARRQDRRARGRARFRGVRGLALVLSFLRDAGAAPSPAAAGIIRAWKIGRPAS